MQFTPGQLREMVGISVETFRHWKRVLPPFANSRRHAPCFSVGDLLAGGVVRRLTEGCGIRVGHLAGLSTEIARVCNSTAWAALERKALLIDLPGGTCRLASGTAKNESSDILLICEMAPVMRQLRETMLRSQGSDQRALLFPPVDVDRPRARRSTR